MEAPFQVTFHTVYPPAPPETLRPYPAGVRLHLAGSDLQAGVSESSAPNDPPATSLSEEISIRTFESLKGSHCFSVKAGNECCNCRTAFHNRP